MEETPASGAPGSDIRGDDDLEQTLAEQAESASEITRDRAGRFYDRIRGRIRDYVDKKGQVLGKTADFLLLVPDVFILLWRLLNDGRVSGKDKVLLGTAVVYYVSPFDLLPEAFLGPIGYLDDLVFGVYVLNKILTSTDPAIVRSHWSGDEDVLQSIQRVMNAADELVSKEVIDRLKKMVGK